jgi:hypothetical protein
MCVLCVPYVLWSPGSRVPSFVCRESCGSCMSCWILGVLFVKIGPRGTEGGSLGPMGRDEIAHGGHGCQGRRRKGPRKTQGPKVAQVALKFGADDFGSTMLEENVVRAAGVHNRITEREMVELIRKAGRIPAQRDTKYRMVKSYA